MYCPTRMLSAASGLSSILLQHSKKKTRVQSPLETEEEGGAGIFGKLARQSNSAQTQKTPAKQPPEGHWVAGMDAPEPRSAPFIPSFLKSPAESESGSGYDNRWSQMLKKQPVNGKNGHQTTVTSPAVLHEQQQKHSLPKKQQKIITISDDVTTKSLAQKLGVSITDVERVLTPLGETPESNEDLLSMDAAELAAAEFGVHVKKVRSSTPVEGQMVTRPPVVTVMGHVDHGKTTLLDALRNTSVAAHEAGGITQHIGAFEVLLSASGETLTFLDTPGHAAFSEMRARGTRVTDLVVLVVAADDGVMPQTRESLKLIREAGCQFVVAITKCDLPQADVEKVKTQLGGESIELEEFGGNVQLVAVSAPKGQGLDELQEALLLQATNVDLKARSDIPATAVVVEANKNRGLGPVATVIVTGGTLRLGQPVVIGHHWGRIRQMTSPTGEPLKEVTPGRPVEICGLRSVPQPGDELMVVKDEERAKRVSTARLHRTGGSTHLDGNITSAQNETKNVTFVLKSDTQGTGEAVVKSIQGLSSDVIAPEIVCHAVGHVTEADVIMAAATEAHIIAFNVRTLGHDVEALARHKNVTIHQHTIIYRLLDAVGAVLLDRAPLCEEENVTGEALVQKIFNIRCRKSRSTVCVAGCIVRTGHMQKSDAFLRVFRSNEALFQGPCTSLKRHKLDVDRVGKGTECGILLDAFPNAQEGDVIQTIVKTKRKPKTEAVVGGGIRVVESPKEPISC